MEQPQARSGERLQSFRPLLDALRPQRAGVSYALVLLVLALAVTTALRGQPPYLSTVNVSNILGQAAPDAILAVFMTVVLISGNFDLSIASVAALAAALALKTIDSLGMPAAVTLALLVGLGVGTINATLVQKIGVNAFIVTLGTMTAVRGVVLIILNGESVSAQSQSLVALDSTVLRVPWYLAVFVGVIVLAGCARRAASMRTASAPPLDGFFLASVMVGVGCVVTGAFMPDLLSQPLPVWLMLTVATIVAIGLRFLVSGRNLYAVGSNPEAARLSGIRVDLYKMGPFVLSGVTSAAVGLLYAGRFNSVDPNALTGTELTVIAAAILGGTSLFGGAGFVGKSVLGTIVLFTLSNGFNVLNLGSNYQYVVQGAVLIAASAVYTVATRSRSKANHESAPGSVSSAAVGAKRREEDDRVRQPISETNS